jgi:formate dehydrogenase major subunit
MGLKGFDWNHPKDIWDEIRQNNDWIAEITWEMLVEAGTNGVRYPMKNGKSPERLFSDESEAILGKRFFTEDGKVHVEAFEKVLKFDPMMYEWSGVNKDYPLMAIDFRLNELWNTGYTYWFTPTLYERTPDAFCMIHPEDAKPRGIKDGDWVILRSRYGQCKAKAKVTTDIIKGCVAVPALFPKEDQKNAHILPDTPSPINGDVVTQVAVEVIKIKSGGVKKSKKEI